MSMCRTDETEVRKCSTIDSRHFIVSHAESAILSKYKISKSCCHKGDFEGSEMRRLMPVGSLTGTYRLTGHHMLKSMK